MTNLYKFSILNFAERKWALSSAGRASALQAGGHRFEPYCAHHLFYGLVVQLVRTLACHARGRRFEPVPGRHFFCLIFALIAQLVEQRTENPCVTGSIPVQGTIQMLHAFAVREYSSKRTHVSPNQLSFRRCTF